LLGLSVNYATSADGGRRRWEMNLIVICLDSFRQDHVSFYHGGQPVFDDVPPCQTPNIDAFAQRCVVFENSYPCGKGVLVTLGSGKRAKANERAKLGEKT
jgi:hypothetical protein